MSFAVFLYGKIQEKDKIKTRVIRERRFDQQCHFAVHLQLKIR